MRGRPPLSGGAGEAASSAGGGGEVCVDVALSAAWCGGGEGDAICKGGGGGLGDGGGGDLLDQVDEDPAACATSRVAPTMSR